MEEMKKEPVIPAQSVPSASSCCNDLQSLSFCNPGVDLHKYTDEKNKHR
jgi:hypothetical protein